MQSSASPAGHHSQPDQAATVQPRTCGRGAGSCLSHHIGQAGACVLAAQALVIGGPWLLPIACCTAPTCPVRPEINDLMHGKLT